MAAAGTTTAAPALSTEINNGTVTSWLPLTTAWPSLADCSSQIYTWDGTIMVFDPTFREDQDNTDLYCQPSQMTESWTQSHQTPQLTTTSLEGLACPDMYTTVWSSPVNTASEYVVCCPKSFTPANPKIRAPATDSAFCLSTLTSGQAMSIYINSSSGSDSWFVHSTTTFKSGGTVSAPQINGYAFLTTSSSSSTDTGSVTSSISSSSTSTSATGGSSSGLSTGAKAGIGVGVAVGALGAMALAGALFLLRRYRKRQSAPGTAGTAAQDGQGETVMKMAAPDGSGAPYYTSVKTELPGESNIGGGNGGVHELGPQQPVYEMADER
ncbi:uncharacterized protein LY89DRAFT_717173 [Mollisia scopiformis]|uniref:Uncharacterized protein n=1 Tax=Mollisia scopiformis TaxID=149040 RepID=A0A194XEL2_MOLSC|nr:uncharacterized protein LY89DRAFT_717173 [Mollisia scopiformis]KUJ18584.1 hypothetical protein LY89DRAFT_717173 [Mollisia scopiformis]